MNKRNIELAAEAGAHWEHGDWNLASSVHFSEEDLQEFADLIRADEREEIAQFIEQTNLGSLPEQTALHYAQLLRSYSTAIRARGNT